MNILVTGGLGYIGSHTVVELCNNGYNPVIIDNLHNSQESVLHNIERILSFRPKCYIGDCRDRSLLLKIFKNENISGVIHFAAYKSVSESLEKPQEYYENNVLSLLVLTRSMSEIGLKNLIFSSSCTVYGQPDVLPVTEETQFKTSTSPYGTTKQMCEQILRDLQSISSICLRYFNPIGAHPSALIGELPNGVPNNLVPFITQTAVGKRKELKIFGKDYNTPDGTCVRDFIHVVDLANAHVKALKLLETGEKYQGLALNIGTGQGYSVFELVSEFEKVTGIKLNYTFAERRPGDIEKIYADATKANELLKWAAKKSIQDSLDNAWRWEKYLAESQANEA